MAKLKDTTVYGDLEVTGTVDGVDIAAEETRLANTSGTNTGDNAGVTSVAGGTGLTSTGGNTPSLSVTADSIGDTQLTYNTGQHLTTSSSPTFTNLTINTGLNMTDGAITNVQTLEFNNASNYILKVKDDSDTGVYFDISNNQWSWRENGAERAYIDLDSGNFWTTGTVDCDGIKTTTGATITEFSTDGNLAGNSDVVVPTEKAVKTYVDNAAGGGGGPPPVKRTQEGEVYTATLMYEYIDASTTITEFRAVLGARPEGQNFTIQLNKNGTLVTGTNITITTAASIVNGVYTSTSGAISVAASAGDVLTVVVTQVGSTFSGADLTAIATLS